jgi:hypothetical protein
VYLGSFATVKALFWNAWRIKEHKDQQKEQEQYQGTW